MKRSDFGRHAISIAGNEEVRIFVPARVPPVPPLKVIGSVRSTSSSA
jgi:hypothetical protein